MTEEASKQPQTETEQTGAMESLAGKKYKLKNGKFIPETEYQRRVREYRELWTVGLRGHDMLKLQTELEGKYLAARESFQSPEKEQHQINAIYQSLLTMIRHFLAWENSRQKDMDWKCTIEAELRKAVQEQTRILQAVEDKLDELLNGNSQGQGEMLSLVLGTLNELRERITTLENSSSPKTPPGHKPPASGKR